MKAELIQEFDRRATSPDPALAPAALVIARLEYPHLDDRRYLRTLDRMGAAAAERIVRLGDRSSSSCVAVLNHFLFEEQGFAGNREHYDDPRNSFINEVLDRRTGIPITLALVYMEVARRAGVRVEGINFPGHFLLRCPVDKGDVLGSDLIVDPFHGGALLSEADCETLLQRHAGNDLPFDRELLGTATKQQILVRMLVNLKRIYVRLRSFPQARDIADLLLAIDPSALTELRDRGLLAYHLRDYAAALRDLETYLRLATPDADDEEERQETEQIWEHVKSLRRRLASLN